jgi:hypothetical protein
MAAHSAIWSTPPAREVAYTARPSAPTEEPLSVAGMINTFAAGDSGCSIGAFLSFVTDAAWLAPDLAGAGRI